MKINIAKIKLGTGLNSKFSLEEHPQDLSFDGEEIKFLKSLKVEGEVTHAGGLFTVTGNAETELKLRCGRCLEEFEFPAKVGFDAIFAQNVSQDDDVRVFTGDEIILDDIITEALLLELPFKFLCSEECKGLCPQCGNNLNNDKCSCEKPIDPRFGILAELLKVDDKPKGV